MVQPLQPVLWAASRLGLALLVLAGPAWQMPGSRQIELVAVEDGAGISFVHQYTRGRGESIVESGGSGAAWIDYDVDGDIDVLLVNGLPAWGGGGSGGGGDARGGEDAGDSRRAGGAGHALFRNDGGRFREAPGHAGVADRFRRAPDHAGVADRFRRAPDHAGVADRVWGNGVAVADVDNDGFPDLLITAIGPDRLYRNNGDGTFSAVRAGVEDEGWGTSVAFLDWDRDGFVDLYVARYVAVDPPAARASARTGTRPDQRAGPGSISYREPCLYRGSDIEVFCGPASHTGLRDRFYRGAGDGTFAPWYTDVVDAQATPGFALVTTDCDSDLFPEIYVANDLAVNLLYRRGDEGVPQDRALMGGAGYSGDGRAQAGMAATSGDVDGDGLLDLFVTNFEDDHNTLYHNFGNCSFEDATARYGLAASGIPFMGWGALFVDIDGDADEDLFVANGHLYPQLEVAEIAPFGQRNLLYVNRLRETGLVAFLEAGEAAGGGLRVVASSRSAIRGDYDDDGDADILVTNMNAAPTLLRNDSERQAPALQLVLIGRRSNRTAYGARVRVRSGGVEQHFELRGSDGFQGSNDPRLLVHLPGEVAEVVTIDWPSGERTVLRGEQPGRLVVDEERGAVARRDRR